jgi:hypothetical protein
VENEMNFGRQGTANRLRGASALSEGDCTAFLHIRRSGRGEETTD